MSKLFVITRGFTRSDLFIISEKIDIYLPCQNSNWMNNGKVKQ